MKKLILTLFLVFATTACLCAQQVFELQFPVKCQINKNCWIINYIDDDASTNWHDYKSGRETYDGHTGTDIAVSNISQLKQGVSVVAAASGFVIATRDGVPDKNALAQDTSKLQDIGCGNRVAIKHSGNWVSDYCHMKNGSIKVKKGDFVTVGQEIGKMGMSGLTEFPHLHINIQQNNQFYDPFTGLAQYQSGSKASLWSPQLSKQLIYKPVVVYNVGVSNEIPKLLDIRNEKYKTNRVSSDANMILCWLDMFHVETGDVVDVLVKSQNGTTFFKQHVIIEKPNAKKLLYVGKKKPVKGFDKGTYSVQISFKRPNANINDNRSFSFVVY